MYQKKLQLYINKACKFQEQYGDDHNLYKTDDHMKYLKVKFEAKVIIINTFDLFLLQSEILRYLF